MKLSLPQQDIYFEQLLYPHEPIYNIGAKIEITGPIHLEVLRKAYVELINQHDVYRMIFVNKGEHIEAEFLDEHHSQLGFIDFSAAEHPAEEAAGYMQKEFVKPFDLLSGNLLHIFTLLKINENFHYLFSVYHHIITDGWGTSLMFQRLVQNYNELLEIGEIKSSYPFSYTEFIEDDEQYQYSESFSQEKNYWMDRFKVLPENLLPKIDDSVQVNKSNRKELIVKRTFYNQLNELATELKCSTFHLILSILYTYFGRKYENSDFAIGLPVLNRSKAKYKKTVGLFMGISLLRIQLDFNTTFRHLVTEIKNQLRNDYRYQRFPLGKLIKELRIFKEKERLFNITLSYEKQNYSTCFFDTKTKVIPLTHESERVALAIYIREFDESEDVKIDFDYNLNYFDHKTITQVVQHVEMLMERVLTGSDIKLKDCDYLSQNEQDQILNKFNNTKTEYPENKTIIDLFHEQVGLYPHKQAVTDEHSSYSYTELEKLSDQIATFIITELGAQNRTPIAVLLGRSSEMVIVLLGILKSGRAYIPLDPTFPEERLRYIIDNSQSKFIIAEKEDDLEKIPGVQMLFFKNVLYGITEMKKKTSLTISADDSAYIIYTSGSTGNPKGVEIRHRSLLNFLISMQQKPGLSEVDKFFSVTTYSFDISILEFFAPLISGATVYIATKRILSDPDLIIEKLAEVSPTIIQATPSFYQLHFNANWQGNKKLKILCGGDSLNSALAEKLLIHTSEVWNMYGPTETTIWSSLKKIEYPHDATNIGKPINNTRFHILDSFLKPKPVGIPGAIYIGGDGLAKGYYRNHQLTEKKFVKNPFDKRDTLIYETGDVGKWNNDGEIEFLGRNDNQVKIRGYRIELGDIESHLNQLEEIKDAVVIAKRDEQQDAFLVAFVVPHNENLDKEKIVRELKAKLPHYMVPAVIIALEEFPLTSNQKIDRTFLSKNAVESNTVESEFKPPVSHLQQQLCELWMQVLNTRHPICITDNFFALGGHSLNAVQVATLISKHLFFSVSLKNIFDNPTIELLATYLQKHNPDQVAAIPKVPFKEYYSVTPQQYAIWLASQQKNTSVAYNMQASYIMEGNVDSERITGVIRAMIEKYEILRTNFIEINGIPCQRIRSEKENLFVMSVKKETDGEKQDTIDHFINSEFDLENELLIRVQLLLLESNQYLLLFSTHHIIMDGLSLEIFIKEFGERYNAYTRSDRGMKSRLKFQYKDYAEWYANMAISNAAKNELFWKNYLKNYQSKYSFDRDRGTDRNQRTANTCFFELSAENTRALKQLSVKEETTFYTVLVAALNLLIYKFSDHKDICIWTVNSGRDIPELADQIGMFVKSLILRTEVKEKQTFIDLIRDTSLNLLEISQYPDVPYESITQSEVDIMLVYQNPGFSYEESIQLCDLKLTSYSIVNRYSRIPIVLNLFEAGNKLKCRIDYNADLFEANTMEMIALMYCRLLEEVINNPLAKMNLMGIESELKQGSPIDFEFDF